MSHSNELPVENVFDFQEHDSEHLSDGSESIELNELEWDGSPDPKLKGKSKAQFQLTPNRAKRTKEQVSSDKKEEINIKSPAGGHCVITHESGKDRNLEYSHFIDSALGIKERLSIELGLGIEGFFHVHTHRNIIPMRVDRHRGLDRSPVHLFLPFTDDLNKLIEHLNAVARGGYRKEGRISVEKIPPVKKLYSMSYVPLPGSNESNTILRYCLKKVEGEWIQTKSCRKIAFPYNDKELQEIATHAHPAFIAWKAGKVLSSRIDDAECRNTDFYDEFKEFITDKNKKNKRFAQGIILRMQLCVTVYELLTDVDRESFEIQATRQSAPAGFCQSTTSIPTDPTARILRSKTTVESTDSVGPRSQLTLPPVASSSQSVVVTDGPTPSSSGTEYRGKKRARFSSDA